MDHRRVDPGHPAAARPQVGASGRELRATDGTTAGTSVYADLLPGPAPGSPAGFALGGGRMFVAADTGKGLELHALDLPGASARSLGQGCGDPTPTIEATTPVLGSTLVIRGAGIPANRIGWDAASLRPRSSLDRGRGCTGHLDFATLVIQRSGMTSGPTYQLTLPIPNVPALVGARLVCQPWFAAPTGPAVLETSNGLELTAGR